MTTKEKFIKRYNDIKSQIISDLDAALEKALGNGVVNLNSCSDDYRDVYPLIGAVLLKENEQLLNGSLRKETNNSAKKQAKKYLNDYRVWREYAGDYKDKQRNGNAD